MVPNRVFPLVAHAAHGGLLGVPWWTVVVAGPAFVALTYLTLRATPPVRRDGWRLGVPRAVMTTTWSVLGGAAVVALAATLVIGFRGPERATANVVYYLSWLVPLGATVAVLVVGDAWRRIDPIESLAALVGAPATQPGRRSVGAAVGTESGAHSADADAARASVDHDRDRDDVIGAERRGIGAFPGLAFFAFWWVPSCYVGALTARLIAVWLASWVVWGVVAGRLRGRAWVSARDPFRLLLDTIGRQALLRGRADGLVAGVSPARRGDPQDPATAPRANRVLEIMIGVLVFRLVAVTPWWIEIERPLRDWSLIGMRTFGLVWACALVVLVHFVTAAATTRFRRGDRALLGDLLGALAAGMIIGGLLPPGLTAAQNVLALLSDPFDQGWDTFGTITWRPVDLTANAVVAWLEPVAIIGGGVAGVAAGLAAVRRRADALDWPLMVAAAGTVGTILWLNLHP
ncbi:MAG: hypothetical protein S0880_23585 [Actinomycetota bacterium]|nr:hypothetical protein [Actinomycetota bacterium]